MTDRDPRHDDTTPDLPSSSGTPGTPGTPPPPPPYAGGGPFGPPPPAASSYGTGPERDPYAGTGPERDPYAAPLGAQAPAPAPAKTHDARARRRFAAGVLAAALVVGGGGGIGGAAAWDALHGDDVQQGTRSTVAQASSTSDSTGSAAADGTIESVASKVLPSVVKIDVSGQQGSGSGSGIILSEDGQILTNNHVIAVAGDGGSIKVFFNDGSSADATIVGTDPLTDTALIQAADVSGLTPASIGTSGDLQVGQGVVAVGSPFGLESTVTSGIVSALDRPVDVGSDSQGNSTTYPAIQTDAAINPGNSGGALVDMAGNVVGINSSIRTATSSSSEEAGSIGLGFAIPIDEVLPIIEQMANGQTPTHARLGVSVSEVGATQQSQQDPQSPSVPEQLNPFGQQPEQQQPEQQQVLPTSEGAQVQTVTAGSTAANAGIAVGDVITKVDDRIITGADSLVATIRSYRPGDQVTVTYTRGGETSTAQLTLDSDADASAS